MYNAIYEEISLDIFEKELAQILNDLKKTYIEYHGENDKNKIETVIDNLQIVYLVENYPMNEIDERIKNAKEEYNDYLRELLKNSPDSAEEDLIYYLSKNTNSKSTKLATFKEKLNKLCIFNKIKREKEDDRHLNIILGMNKGTLSPIIQERYKNISHDILGSSSSYNNQYLIVIRINEKGKISLHTLIHEIGHQLQKEEMAEVIDDNPFKNKIVQITGITDDDDDLVNEIVNDHYSKTIFDLYTKKYNSPLLDLTFKSTYLDIDALCGNVVKKIYELLKDEIKDKLISGQAGEIKKIINGINNNRSYGNYDLLNKLLGIVLDDIKIGLQTNNITISEYLNQLSEERKNKYKEYAEDIYISTIKKYYEYRRYNRNVKKTVDKMIENKEARRFK